MMVTEVPVPPQLGSKKSIVGAGIGVGVGVTVCVTLKVQVAVLEPSVAVTNLRPVDRDGIVAGVEKLPLKFVVVEPRDEPSMVMLTEVLAPKLKPITVTFVPTGPWGGDMLITGSGVGVGVGTGLFTVKVWALDVPPPGAGVKTVMSKVPAAVRSLAGIVAINWVPPPP
jgi:hypothetical protein